MSRDCLLIIDVQQGLIDEGPEDRDAFLDRLKTLLDAARRTGTLVTHVQHEEAPGEQLAPGAAEWQLHPAVRPQNGEPIFPKRFNSAFKETELETWLKEQKVESLVVVGMQTEYCLDATIKGAFERGYRLTVPEGGHTTYANGALTAAQVRNHYQDRIWRGRFAAVKSVEQVLADFARTKS